ncbi:MAG: hypothetical protein ACP5HM_12610 [Anaerolineae bacterium]
MSKNPLMFTPGLLALVMGLLMSACTTPKAEIESPTTFLLRREHDPGTSPLRLWPRYRGDVAPLHEIVEGAAEDISAALMAELQGTGTLQAGYPISGVVALTPDLHDPNVQHMHCAVEDASTSTSATCILLGESGDFIVIRPITYETAAFYPYRVYVSPRSPFLSLNPAEDFVALWPVVQEQDLRLNVDQAIRAAAVGMGAYPFQP